MERYSDDKLKCLSGLPINFMGEELKQYSMKEIVEFGIKEYYDLCFPFLLTLDYFNIEDKKIKVFDVFWIVKEKVNDKYLLEMLVNSLVYFFNTNDIELDNMENIIRINKKCYIHRDNFDLLSEKIRLISVTEPLKVSNNKNEEIKNTRAKKYLEAREKYSRKNGADESIIKSTYEVISYLVHSQSYLDYNGTMSLTMYQAINSFNILNKKEKYKVNLNAHFAGAKLNKKDLEHWIVN